MTLAPVSPFPIDLLMSKGVRAREPKRGEKCHIDEMGAAGCAITLEMWKGHPAITVAQITAATYTTRYPAAGIPPARR
jgi:hypothetical protein